MFGLDKHVRGPRVSLLGRAGASKVFVVGGIVGAVLFAPQNAAADLSEDVDRLVLEWSQKGARTERLAPVFAEHAQTRLIELGPKFTADPKPGCITVALLGAPTIDFVVAPFREGVPFELLPLPEGHPGVAPNDDSVRSTLGIATITKCNEERAKLERIVVAMQSPRGAIDTVVARSAATLGDARDIFSERATGFVAPRGNPGRPLEPGPLAERVVRAESRARFDGAQVFSRVSAVASADGLGQTRLRLAEGCHRIAVMAAVPSTFPHQATDVDAEARDDEGRVLARDRAETPDARLDFCIGEAARISIVFGGASGAVPVTLVDAVWPLPEAILNSWGSRVRAGFASAFRQRNAPAPVAAPSAEALGSSGATMIPAAIEPGRCYFAAAAVLRGEPRSMRISATIGDKFVRDEVGEHPEGVGLAFCSDAEDSVRIDVDARGNNVFWVFALFPLAGGNP